MTTAASRVALAIAAGAAALLAASPAVAGDAEDDLEGTLNENVVSGASKSAETASDAPATTVTLTAADIRRYGLRSLDEAIDFLGMGLITQNPLHSVEIGGRGVLLTGDFGNHVLLVVDGHVMNEAWNGTAYFEQGAGVPIEMIDHVELVLGAGSVLYGGSAMLGVVNVVTKSASSYRGVHGVAEGSLSPQYGRGGVVSSFAPGALGGSYRFGAGFGHEFSILGHAAELTAHVEYFRQLGPSFEWGPQAMLNADGQPYAFGPRAAPGVWGGRTRAASYDTAVPTGIAKLVVGDFTLWVRATSYKRSTPYMNGLNQYSGDFDDPHNAEIDRWVSADLQWRKRVGENLSLGARLYADSYDYRQQLHNSEPSYCTLGLGGGCASKLTGLARWSGVELQAVEDWLGDDRLTTMLGFDGRVRYVGSKTDWADLASGATLGTTPVSDTRELAWAAYLQQRWTPAAALHLNGGVRFDKEARGGSRLSPRVAATLDAWRGATLKAVYAEAFRAPTYYETYYQEEGVQIPASNLKSETVRSAEASLEQKWGAQRLLFGVFRTWWNDMIALQALDDGTYQYRNVSRIDNYGFNGLFEGTAGDLRYALSLTEAYTRRQTPDGAQSLPVSPSLFGNARVSYDLPGALPTIALATTLVSSRLADRANDGGFAVTPIAPAQVRLRLTLSDKVPGHEALSWRLSAEYSTAGRGAYVAGPIQSADSAIAGAIPRAELAPVNRFAVFATVQYDLGL